MVKLSKILKGALIYGRLAYCSNNSVVGYILKERRLISDSILEKRALNGRYYSRS